MKKGIVAWLLLITLLLCGCSERISSSDSSDSEEPTSSLQNMPNLPEKLEDIQIADVEYLQDGLIYQETHYQLYCNNLVKYDSPLSYEWYVDWNFFTPIARTEDGEILFSMTDDSNKEILLLCDPESGENIVRCYAQDDCQLLDVTAYALSDFAIQIDGKSLTTEEQEAFSAVWEMHTNLSGRSSLFLDGDNRVTHLSELRSVQYPGLVYRLYYNTLGDNGQNVEILNLFCETANEWWRLTQTTNN